MRLNIVRDLVKQIKSPRWVDTWARDMVMGYWSVAILFWQLSIDHIVNVQCKRCGLAKTRLRHPSLPFDSLPYPTRTICRRVRMYVRHTTVKRLSMRGELRGDRYVRFGKATYMWLRLLADKNREIVFVFQESSRAMNRKNKRNV